MQQTPDLLQARLHMQTHQCTWPYRHGKTAGKADNVLLGLAENPVKWLMPGSDPAVSRHGRHYGRRGSQTVEMHREIPQMPVTLRIAQYAPDSRRHRQFRQGEIRRCGYESGKKRDKLQLLLAVRACILILERVGMDNNLSVYYM